MFFHVDSKDDVLKWPDGLLRGFERRYFEMAQ
jgi:hypothetical protein